MTKIRRGTNEISTEAICVFNKYSQSCLSGLKPEQLDYIDSLPLCKESKHHHLLVSYNFRRAFNGRITTKSQYRAKQTTIVLDFDKVGCVESEDSLLFEEEFRTWNSEFMDGSAILEISASGNGRHITLILSRVLSEDEFAEYVKGITISLANTFMYSFIDINASSSIHRSFYDTHLFRNRISGGLINKDKASQKTVGFWATESTITLLCELRILLLIAQDSRFTDEKRYRYRIKAREVAYRILKSDRSVRVTRDSALRLFAEDLLDEWSGTFNCDPSKFYNARVPFVINKELTSQDGTSLLVNSGLAEFFSVFRPALEQGYIDVGIFSEFHENPEFRIKEDGETLTLSKLFGSKSNSGVVDLVNTITFCMEKSNISIINLKNAMGFNDIPGEKSKRIKINPGVFLECVITALRTNKFLSRFNVVSLTPTACYQVLDFLLYSAQSNEIKLKETVDSLCIILSVFNSQLADKEVGRPFYEIIKQRVRKAKGVYAEESVSILEGVRDKFTELSRTMPKGAYYTGKSIFMNEKRVPELLNCFELILEEIRISSTHTGKKYRFGMHKLRRYICLTNSNQYTILRQILMAYLSEGTDVEYIPHYRCKEYLLKDFVIKITESKPISVRLDLESAATMFRESLGVGGNTYETIRKLSRVVYDASGRSLDLTISVIHGILDEANVNELGCRKKEVVRYVNKIESKLTSGKFNIAA
jgi:hypothetical protein